jgi:hypothetical protein
MGPSPMTIQLRGQNAGPGDPPGHDQAQADGRQAANRVELGHHQAEGPKRGEYFDRCLVIDNFSRHVAAWCVAPTESADLAH